MTKAAIYTRTGDRGTTSLVGGKRIDKHSSRIEAYGTIDELNAHLGLISSHPHIGDNERQFIIALQSHLFDIGSYLACDPDGDIQLPSGVTPQRLDNLEKEIDRLNACVPQIKNFTLPTGTPLAATCHVARTVCRRAERRITALAAEAPVAPEVSAYINRLSDFLYILSRFCNINQNQPEIFWQKDC